MTACDEATVYLAVEPFTNWLGCGQRPNLVVLYRQLEFAKLAALIFDQTTVQFCNPLTAWREELPAAELSLAELEALHAKTVSGRELWRSVRQRSTRTGADGAIDTVGRALLGESIDPRSAGAADDWLIRELGELFAGGALRNRRDEDEADLDLALEATGAASHLEELVSLAESLDPGTRFLADVQRRALERGTDIDAARVVGDNEVYEIATWLRARKTSGVSLVSHEVSEQFGGLPADATQRQLLTHLASVYAGRKSDVSSLPSSTADSVQCSLSVAYLYALRTTPRAAMTWRSEEILHWREALADSLAAYRAFIAAAVRESADIGSTDDAEAYLAHVRPQLDQSFMELKRACRSSRLFAVVRERSPTYMGAAATIGFSLFAGGKPVAALSALGAGAVGNAVTTVFEAFRRRRRAREHPLYWRQVVSG